MKIRIAVANASVSITDESGETVYVAAVENYSMSATPAALVASIAECAQDVVAAYEDAQSKLAASL